MSATTRRLQIPKATWTSVNLSLHSTFGICEDSVFDSED